MGSGGFLGVDESSVAGQVCGNIRLEVVDNDGIVSTDFVLNKQTVAIDTPAARADFVTVALVAQQPVRKNLGQLFQQMSLGLSPVIVNDPVNQALNGFTSITISYVPTPFSFDIIIPQGFAPDSLSPVSVELEDQLRSTFVANESALLFISSVAQYSIDVPLTNGFGSVLPTGIPFRGELRFNASATIGGISVNAQSAPFKFVHPADTVSITDFEPTLTTVSTIPFKIPFSVRFACGDGGSLACIPGLARIQVKLVDQGDADRSNELRGTTIVQADVNGVAVFTDLAVQTPGTYVFVFDFVSTASILPTRSSLATIQPGDVTSFRFSQQPFDILFGAQQTVAVEAIDQFGNVVNPMPPPFGDSRDTVTLQVLQNGLPFVKPPPEVSSYNSTFDSAGSAAFLVSLCHVGFNFSFQFSWPAFPQLPTFNSALFTSTSDNDGGLLTFAFSNFPTSIELGVPFSFSINLQQFCK